MSNSNKSKTTQGTGRPAFAWDTKSRRHHLCLYAIYPLRKTTRLLAVVPDNDFIASKADMAATAATTSWMTDVPSSAASITMLTPSPQSFEPIVNVPALISSVFIAAIFGALIVRTNQVENAVQERNLRLKELRSYKAKSLEKPNDKTAVSSSSSSTEESQKSATIDDDLKGYLQRYEAAVQREEQLRNVLPWTSRIRIVAPSGNRPEEIQARADARRFLGKEYDIGSASSLSSSSTTELSSGRPKRGRNEIDSESKKDTHQNLPIWPLVFVVSSQLALVAFFTSLQDAATTSPFNDTIL